MNPRLCSLTLANLGLSRSRLIEAPYFRYLSNQL